MPKKINKAEMIFGLGAIVLAITIFLIGQKTKLIFFRGTTPGAAFMPYLTAAGIGLCGFWLFFKQLLNMRQSKKDKTNDKKDNNTEENKIKFFKKQDIKNFIVVIVSSILIVILANPLGFLISLTLGIIAMAKFLGTPSWRTSILVGIGSGISFYLIFDLFLKVPLPRGLFGI
ncbi:MAG: tripartite tricarboxylate transporter TctB family protein [Deltaproteobacteria bacterium]|jgi:hypothetical protein|nr:tripartite tricarboxylate transporter TctB family protein [Deltaproteobacteria bacterium]